MCIILFKRLLYICLAIFNLKIIFGDFINAIYKDDLVLVKGGECDIS